MADDTHDYRQLVDQLPDLICRYRPDGLLLYVNTSYCTFHSKAAADLIGRSFLELVPQDLRDEVERSLRRVQHLTPADPIVVNEHRSIDGLGRIRWQQWTDKGVFGPLGELTEVMAIGRDVTDRRMAEEQATFLASHDPLTGLLNRRSIMHRLEDELGRSRRLGRRLAVLYLDLDDFKSVNDERGHAVGDRVLEEAAERIVAAFRQDDILGRLGGDEFVVVCPDVASISELMPIVERLENILAEPMLGVDGLELSASVGWMLSDGTESAGEILKTADAAMYRAKTDRH